jgi:hypothetical protein
MSLCESHAGLATGSGSLMTIPRCWTIPFESTTTGHAAFPFFLLMFLLLDYLVVCDLTLLAVASVLANKCVHGSVSLEKASTLLGIHPQTWWGIPLILLTFPNRPHLAADL